MNENKEQAAESQGYGEEIAAIEAEAAQGAAPHFHSARVSDHSTVEYDRECVIDHEGAAPFDVDRLTAIIESRMSRDLAWLADDGKTVNRFGPEQVAHALMHLYRTGDVVSGLPPLLGRIIQREPGLDRVPEHVQTSGHKYVHVAACPCPEMQAEVARLSLPSDEREGEPDDR